MWVNGRSSLEALVSSGKDKMGQALGERGRG